jgi:hypothetical protein
MRFEWDPKKNRINLQKHGLVFNDVTSLFESEIPFLVDYDDLSPEERWVGIGLLKNHVIVVVYTEPDDETIRLISARLANKYEQERYY